MADPARARKVADRIKTVTAANLEAVVKNPDLGFVTITDVRVTNDLQQAAVFYTVFGDESQRDRTAAVLEENRGRLRSFVGKQLGIRLTPAIEFIADGIPENAAHVEELLERARERDAQVAAAAATASYAGAADPYRKDEDPDTGPDSGDEADADPVGLGVAAASAVTAEPGDGAPSPATSADEEA